MSFIVSSGGGASAVTRIYTTTNSLPQAAKNALARAAGIPLPTESSL